MGTSKKQKKRDGLRYREFVLSPYGVIKIKSLGYTVKVNNGIKRIQRPLLPALNFIHHSIGHLRNEASGNIDTVDFFKVCLNITG